MKTRTFILVLFIITFVVMILGMILREFSIISQGIYYVWIAINLVLPFVGWTIFEKIKKEK